MKRRHLFPRQFFDNPDLTGNKTHFLSGALKLCSLEEEKRIVDDVSEFLITVKLQFFYSEVYFMS